MNVLSLFIHPDVSSYPYDFIFVCGTLLNVAIK